MVLRIRPWESSTVPGIYFTEARSFALIGLLFLSVIQTMAVPVLRLDGNGSSEKCVI